MNQDRTYPSIKELVFDLVQQTRGLVDYETVTAKVRKIFPKSKWQESHWAWYRNQMTNGRFQRQFSERTRANLQVARKRAAYKNSERPTIIRQQQEWGRKVESRVKELLRQKYGQTFEGKRLKLARGQEKQFDAVSKDGTVVAMVKAFKIRFNDSTETQLKTRFNRCVVDCAYLAVVPNAVHRLFYLNRDYLPKFEPQIEMLFQGKVSVHSI